jgi:hypothetical protein
MSVRRGVARSGRREQRPMVEFYSDSFKAETRGWESMGQRFRGGGD